MMTIILHVVQTIEIEIRKCLLIHCVWLRFPSKRLITKKESVEFSMKNEVL